MNAVNPDCANVAATALGADRARRAVAGALLLALAACQRTPAPPVATPLQVEVRQMAARSIRDTIELDGVVAPSQQVNLVARVAGILEAVRFKDGELVHRGQSLFVVERAPYLEQVRLNQARLDESRSEYQRQLQLMKENATAQASVDSAQSTLQQAQANLKLAQLNLDYTDIRAPFDGMIGRRLVDAGNYVGATAGGTVLATLMRLSPAYVNAAVGERDALRVRQKMAHAGALQRSGVGSAPVRARLQGEQESSATGVLDFVDHALGSGSGTIALRGRFSNADRHLLPGLYARLSINLGAPRDVMVLPRAVVMNDQQGEFVYVVGGADKAMRRKVTTAPLPGEESEITSGLAANERVIVKGYGRVVDGQAVKPVAAALAAGAGAIADNSR